VRGPGHPDRWRLIENASAALLTVVRQSSHAIRVGYVPA
jgi:hypothetical protein